MSGEGSKRYLTVSFDLTEMGGSYSSFQCLNFGKYFIFRAPCKITKSQIYSVSLLDWCLNFYK